MRILVLLVMFALSLDASCLTIYGHRGARGLAPENTFPSIKEALKHQVDVIDLDIVMTKDDVIVVYHDLTLNPDITRNPNGRWIEDNHLIVKELTLKKLQTYDVGRIRPGTLYAATYASQKPYDHTSISTLQEMIRYVKRNAHYPVGFQIEIKTDPTDPSVSVEPEKIVIALNQVIEAEGIAEISKVQAFDWRCLQLLQQLNPKIQTAYLTDGEREEDMQHLDSKIAGVWTAGYLLKNYHDSIPEMIHALGGTWWDAEARLLTQEAVQKAHAYGLKVAAWTCPECSDERDVDIALAKQLVEMKVDGIITDRPDVITSSLLSTMLFKR